MVLLPLSGIGCGLVPCERNFLGEAALTNGRNSPEKGAEESHEQPTHTQGELVGYRGCGQGPTALLPMGNLRWYL